MKSKSKKKAYIYKEPTQEQKLKIVASILKKRSEDN